MSETRETRLKRIRIRSWRRGTKEMDMLLGPYADGPLQSADEAALARFEALLNENDQDLYAWVSGAAEPPAAHAVAIAAVAAHHGVDQAGA